MTDMVQYLVGNIGVVYEGKRTQMRSLVMEFDACGERNTNIAFKTLKSRVF